MAATVIRITAIPTQFGEVTSKYRDGLDLSGGAPPNAPQINQPVANGSTSVFVPLGVAATGGTAPYLYGLEFSSTSAIAGFSDITSPSATLFSAGGGVYTAAGLTADTTYWIRPYVIDDNSLRSAYGLVFSVATPAVVADTTPPSDVTGLNITQTDASQFTATWNAATDNVGVVGYNFTLGDGDGAGNPTGTSVTLILAGTSTSLVMDSIAVGEHFGRVRARDAAGNVSVNATARFFFDIVEPVATHPWHPGHYVKTQGEATQNDQTSYLSTVINGLGKSLDLSLLKGGFAAIAWGAMNPTGATFDGSGIDQMLDWCTTNNRRLILQVKAKNNTPSTKGLCAPADLTANDVVANISGYVTAVWRPAVMDRFIEAMEWVAANYDGHPKLEIITTMESSASGPVAGDYTTQAYATELIRLNQACAAAFTHTNLVIPSTNFLVGGQLTGIIEAGYQSRTGFGGPDSIETSAIKLFRGETVTGQPAPPRDYRGTMLNYQIASAPAMGGKDDNGPPSNIINWAQINEVTHLAWVTTVGASPNTWAEIKTAIQADQNLHSACPTRYSACDIT